jgi:1-acyl-sn-glycerol-3-phosphate acyltransferase
MAESTTTRRKKRTGSSSNGRTKKTTRGKSNGRATTVRGKPSRPARKAQRKAEKRREEASGVAGVVAGRAGDYDLSPPSERFLNLQMPIWNLLADHYFRMDVRGWERLPRSPSLLIGIHAGGIVPIDAYLFGYQWYREFGMERILRGTAHDFLMASPGIGHYLRAGGVVPAGADSITRALEAGDDVVLYPGGDVDALRPWTKRDKVVFGGRKGYVRQAIMSRVPIVPVANVGASDTLFVLASGRRVAKLLRLDKTLRAEAFPIAFGFPLGLAPGIIPQIPLPAKIRSEILDPVDLGDDPERADDSEFVRRKAREVERKLQAGMDRLAKRRSFPIFG